MQVVAYTPTTTMYMSIQAKLRCRISGRKHLSNQIGINTSQIASISMRMSALYCSRHHQERDLNAFATLESPTMVTPTQIIRIKDKDGSVKCTFNEVYRFSVLRLSIATDGSQAEISKTAH